MAIGPKPRTCRDRRTRPGSRSPTTASAAPTRPAAPVCAGSPTAWRRSAGASTSPARRVREPSSPRSCRWRPARERGTRAGCRRPHGHGGRRSNDGRVHDERATSGTPHRARVHTRASVSAADLRSCVGRRGAVRCWDHATPASFGDSGSARSCDCDACHSSQAGVSRRSSETPARQCKRQSAACGSTAVQRGDRSRSEPRGRAWQAGK
jgi:hypothetical protein